MDDPETQNKWFGIAALSVLQLLAHFIMREGHPARVFPNLLCWLVRRPADEACEGRRNMCQDLLRMTPEEIHCPTSLKIKFLFHSELDWGARTGYCDPGLFELINDVMHSIRCDTQWVEGVNNIIKTYLRDAPASVGNC